MEGTAMTAEEIAAMQHPPLVDPSKIVSGMRLGQTKVFVMRPEAVTAAEKLRRQKHYAEVSWNIVWSMRERGEDV